MRIYDKWAGNPEGIREDPKRCVVEVSDYYLHRHQCLRPRGHGVPPLFCWQHAKMKPREGWDYPKDSKE